MQCAKCHQPLTRFDQPCPHCQFDGDAILLETLSHIEWVLREAPSWPQRDAADHQHTHLIRQQYRQRLRNIQIQLGLRAAPAQVRALWLQVLQHEALLARLEDWQDQDILQTEPAQNLRAQTRQQRTALLTLLEDTQRPKGLISDQEHLTLVNSILDIITQQGAALFQNVEAYTQARTALLTAQATMEQRLHPRITPSIAISDSPTQTSVPIHSQTPPPPIAQTSIPARSQTLPPPTAQTSTPPHAQTPPPPSVPLRERFWRTLISERTLQAMLFLGIFLLFSAAISYVIWGWESFSAPVRVAIPTTFTLGFFGMGWYVRKRTRLYRSGIALSAIAALFIPIDFYTIYINFDIPPSYGPTFWFITSVFCVAAYTIATRIIRSRFFGYLVAAALGSVALSLVELAHQAFALSLDWRTASLSVLSLILIIAATYLDRFAPVEPSTTPTPNRLRRWLNAIGLTLRSNDEIQGDSVVYAFAEPFRNLALLTLGVLLPLTFGWRYISGRNGFDTFHDALTVNWWIGGVAFAWGAVHYRSRSLGVLAALSLPFAMYLTQASIFNRLSINAAWHAVGLALLAPLYLSAGYKLLPHTDDVIHGHGRTAVGWGIVLFIVAALWALTDLRSSTAAAFSHTILTGTALLATYLWQRPRFLYGASFLSLTATTFWMNELNLPFAQLSVGWASLAIAHLLSALRLSARHASTTSAQRPAANLSSFAKPLTVAAYLIAALALLPPLFPYNGEALLYALTNWLGMTIWGAQLAHRNAASFAISAITRQGRVPLAWHRFKAMLFHWLTALPLPLWLYVFFTNRGALNANFPIALSALMLVLFALSLRLAPLRADRAYRWPWYLVSFALSILAPNAAFRIAPASDAPMLCLLATGLLYFTDAFIHRHSFVLLPAGLISAWGFFLWLSRWALSSEATTLLIAWLIVLYLCGGLTLASLTRHHHKQLRSPETRAIAPPKRLAQFIVSIASFDHTFLTPLYLAAHLLSIIVLIRVYLAPLAYLLFRNAWTDEMRLWGAATQISLGVAYGLYAWARYRRFWAHVAIWLVTAGGVFVAISYSTGSGSLAARAALGALAYILLERSLNALRRRETLQHARRLSVQWAWRLYAPPLLAAGWLTSIATIGIALVRNLILLGAGRIQQIWAAVALLLIVLLYALSARLFRQARFAWFAALLSILPWTILTNLGWFVFEQPQRWTFAISWLILAWVLFALQLALIVYVRRQPDAAVIEIEAYAKPLRYVAHGLVQFALLWGSFDNFTSRITFALAIAFYAVAATLDIRSWLATTRAQAIPPVPEAEADDEAPPMRPQTLFLYLAFGLVPVWCAYWLAWLWPNAQLLLYGLMLLIFGPLGLLAGQWLQRGVGAQLRDLRLPPKNAAQLTAFGLPAYIVGYACVTLGTLINVNNSALSALVMLYNSALMVLSARVFRRHAWVYLALLLTTFALMMSLDAVRVPWNRHGWGYIALAAAYLALAWALRRKQPLTSGLYACGTGALIGSLALSGLGAAISAQDRTGAFWGFGASAALYALSAFWLKQPSLLWLTSAFAVVPYAVALTWSPLDARQYGIALLPGAAVALLFGWALDRICGAWRNFPWTQSKLWETAAIERVRCWWALPLYLLGFGLAAFSPIVTLNNSGRAFPSGALALNFAGQALVFAWGLYRFRLRSWLLVTVAASQLCALFAVHASNRWQTPTELWLLFTPVTLLTTVTAMWIENHRREGSPFYGSQALQGWSHPLYLLVGIDVMIAQFISLSEGGHAGAALTLNHALLLALLASWWLAKPLTYLSGMLGVVAYVQWLVALRDGAPEGFPVALAQLTLAYGLVGYGLKFILNRSANPKFQIANPQPQPLLSLWAQPLQSLSLGLSVGVLFLTAQMGIDIADWIVRALFGFRAWRIEIAQMWVGVLSLIGLLYLTASLAHQRLRFGYAAIAMLLLAWMTHAFFVNQWLGSAQVQWYALPAGLYLLTIAYLETERGHKQLARWIDYAAVLLMMGSLFWQTLLFGWTYALLLGSEGFGAFWWGSARRLRRFLYIGMIGVMLATIAQLINSLQSINQWIVFGLIGLILFLVAFVAERKLDELKAWREVLETWE